MTTLEVKENFQVCTWAGSLFVDQKRGHHPIISEDIHPLASVVGSIIAKSHEHMLGRTDVEKKKKILAKGKQRPRRTVLYKWFRALFSATKSCPTLLCWTPWAVPHQAPLSMWFPNKNTGVCCHFLLQGIFLTQGLNLCLLLCRRILYHWSPYKWFKSCLTEILIIRENIQTFSL